MKLNISILCQTCKKCVEMKDVLEKALAATATEATITHISNFSEFSKYSVNVSQTPILLINGSVEFAAQAPPLDILCKRLSEIKEGGNIL